VGKGKAIVKVITERRVKKGEEEKYILLISDTHAVAKQEPSYITAEPLVSIDDPSVLLVVSTWESVDDWKAWVNSEAECKLGISFVG